MVTSDPVDAVSLLQSWAKHCREMYEVKGFEGFWMERFTTDHLQFSSTSVKIYLLGGWLDTHPKLGIFLNFLISLDSKS